MVDTTAQLCLFNHPRVLLRDSQVEIRPPLAFQVLVALALSKPRTQSRSEIARSLFPGVDPKERRSQLRIVLSHLRKKLHDLGITELYSERGTDLKLNDAVSLDAYELLAGNTVARPRLSQYAQPVLVGCQSRFAERCRAMVKNMVESSLPAILAQCQTDEELWATTPTLSQLNALYPLSAVICASHVAVLKRVHLYEEATQEITEFETDWFEAYGAHDRPDIDTLVQKLTRTTNEPTRLGVK